MKKWKKYALSGACATMAVTACFAFAACQRESGVKNQFVVDEGDIRTLTGEAGAGITFPEVEKEGFIFKGWYISSDFTGMPVTSATFDGETVYYARWAQGYEVTLDLDGGSVSGYDASKKVYLEKGASIADFVKSYIPTNGEYQFGGWYVNGALVGANDKMPASNIEIVARYKAQYTVNVHLENLDDTGYTVNEDLKATGYALIGENYTPELTVTGFTKTTHGSEVTTKTISKNQSENVFEYYFSRNEVKLTLNSNYPTGSPDLEIQTYRYGETVALPDNPFSADRCRFLGWADSPISTYEEVMSGGIELYEDQMVYAVWNIAYVNALSGEDYIYHVFDTDDSGALVFNEGKITLSRGGVDIESSAYDPETGIYTVSGEDVDLSVKLNGDGTFLYYGSAAGTYYLAENGSIDPARTIVLDKANGITYASAEEGNVFTKTGIYTFDLDGTYTAVVSDGTAEETLVFKTGVAQTPSGAVAVFQVRGEEFDYGLSAEDLGIEVGSGQNYMFRMPGFYYPGISLDGFGSGCALFPANSGEEIALDLTYRVANGVLQFTIPEYSQTPFVAKFIDYNGVMMYVFYEPALDKTFTGANGATLELDGVDAAVYTNGDETVTGAFSFEKASVYDYIVTVGEGAAARIYLIKGSVFFESENSFIDYRFINEETEMIGAPFLAITGTTGTLYEVRGEDVEAVSTGTISRNGVKYVYTVTGDIASWAQTKYTEITFMTESVYLQSGDSANIFYILSYKTAEGETEVASVYTNGTAKLTVTQLFAVYENGNAVLTDIYEEIEGMNVIVLSTDGGYRYFELQADRTFIELATAPVLLQKRVSDGEYSETERLLLTGRVNDQNEPEAVYTDGDSTWTGTYNSKPTNYSGGGMSAGVYIFTGTNQANESKTVYFNYGYTVIESKVVYYFAEYGENDPLAVLGAMAADGDVTSLSAKISLMRDGSFVYTDGSSAGVKGTISENKDYYVFGEVSFTVYTFTPEGGNAFRYTLRQKANAVYFMVAEEEDEITYTAADGSELILDPVVHVAKYIDENGSEKIEFYFAEENVLNDRPAYNLNGTYVFDIAQNGTSFTVRGAEAGIYFVMKNGDSTGNVMQFNGYGEAVNFDSATQETENGTYTFADEIFTVTLDGVSFAGKPGVVLIGNEMYDVLYVEETGFAGSYLNEKDLSVLVLDAFGNAVKYTTYGEKSAGSYLILDEGTFLLTGSAEDDLSVYAFGAGNTVVLENYSNTYYAYDLSSVEFGGKGIVKDGVVEMYYRYDAQANKVKIYRMPENGETVNAYGFVCEEYTLNDGTITLGGKVYTLGDGETVFTLNGADGSRITFSPAGGQEFEALGSYFANGATDAVSCLVSAYYDGGALNVAVTFDNVSDFNGSTNEYTFSEEYVLTFDADAQTYDLGEATTGIVAIDYFYELGYLYIFKTDEGYTVSGNIVGVGVRFTDGIVSRAGAYHQTYGHLYTCEFTSPDLPGYVWHLSFYLVLDNGAFAYSFITRSLSRISTEAEDYYPVNGSADTVLSSEEVIYSLFDGIEGAQLLFLKYNGEILPVEKAENSVAENVFTIVTTEYSVTSYKKYYYDLAYTLGEDNDAIVSFDSIKKYTVEKAEAANGLLVQVACDCETGEVTEILSIETGRGEENVTACIKNADGTFTATTQVTTGEETAEHTYTVTISKSEDGKLTATVEEVTADEGGSQEGV